VKKIERFFLISAVILALFVITTITAITAAAQNKSGLAPLAPDATLAETQNWLVNALQQNSKTNTGSVERSIKSVEFSGCQLSFTLKTSTSMNTAMQTGDSVPSAAGSSKGIDNSIFSDSPVTSNGEKRVSTDPAKTNDRLQPVNSPASNRSTSTSEVKFDLHLKSPDLLNIRILPVGDSQSRSGKFSQILFTAMAPDPQSPGMAPVLSLNNVFVKAGDAPLIVQGFKQMVSLCGAPGAEPGAEK
jgi:Cu/Ag efflux protein CusF